MALELVLCELDTVALAGAPIGEVLNASNQSLSLRLLTEGNCVAGFTMRLDNPLAKAVTDRDGDVLLKAYWYGSLIFLGDCMSVERSGSIHHIWKRDGLLTRAFSLGPEDQEVRSADDQTAIAARGLYEEVIPGDVGNSEARQALVDANVEIRKVAQQTISFDRSAGDSDTLSLTFAGPLWRLSKRLSGKSTGGVTFQDVARQTIPSTLLTTANLEHDTGIRQATSPPTLEKISFGPVQYKPTSEAFTDSAVLLWPPYVARDGFTAQAVTTPLVGQADTMGNVWGYFPAGTDDWSYVTGNATGVVTRSAVNDGLTGSLRGRVEVSGATGPFTDVTVGVNFSQNTAATANSYYGVCARQSSALDFVLAFAVAGGPSTIDKIQLWKFVGGTPTLVAEVAMGTTIYQDIWYSLQLTILANGDYKVWFYDALGGIGTPKLQGSAYPAFASGVLASGGVGMYDASEEPPTVGGNPNVQRRLYGSFTALDPASTPTSMDFDLVPSEPTVDTESSTLPAGSIRIARLNIASSLGTTKPEAIFEYGTGKKTDPQFGTAYTVGDTVTARSVYNGQVLDNATARVFGVDITIDKEGKETVQPLLSPTS